MSYDSDILISGGGIAGLTAAAAFGSAGFSVICVDPTPPVTEREAKGADMRSTALLQPARDVLEEAGLWTGLATHAAPLQVMRIVDLGAGPDRPPVVKSFDAAEISDQPFGWNFPNWLLRQVLVARLNELPNVDFRTGIGTTTLFTRTAQARVGLTDGSRARVRLVIAADGRDSPMRQAAGIPVTTRRYGQKALAFAVTHPIPHENVSTEIHKSGGPFTLVPLPDHAGLPCSAVVWMDEGPRTQARAEIGKTAFEAEMTDRSAALFGPLTLITPRAVWPIISQHAARLSSERLALIAEAAHVMPPIGAQGLNMSLKDLSTLLGLAREAPEALGDAAMLSRYHTARFRDVQMRVRGIDLLNRTSQAGMPLAQGARAAGLDALYALPPVRHLLMQMGLGVR